LAVVFTCRPSFPDYDNRLVQRITSIFAMPPHICKHCLSPKLPRSSFHFYELGLLLVGVRPHRCGHCFQRQFVIVSPLTMLLSRAFLTIDETINLIHPAVREEYFSRRKRRRRKAAHTSAKQDASSAE